MFFRGNLFPAWRGNAPAGGLSAKAIIRIEPDGALWVLEDGRSGGTGRLLKLTPNG
jgi:aldose sugar dehydrogenase